MEERRVLLCPTCGAPLPPAAANEAVMCQFCKRTSENAHRQATQTALVCPRCEQNLFSGAVHDVSMLACGICGGIWLDNMSAQRAVAKFDEAVTELAVLVSSHAQASVDVRPHVKCADCRAAMTRTQRAGVEIDYCTAHGTWFDAGELDVMLRSLRRREAPAQIAPAPAYAPVYVDTSSSSSSSSSSVDWSGIADVAGGAIELLGLLASL